MSLVFSYCRFWVLVAYVVVNAMTEGPFSLKLIAFLLISAMLWAAFSAGLRLRLVYAYMEEREINLKVRRAGKRGAFIKYDVLEKVRGKQLSFLRYEGGFEFSPEHSVVLRDAIKAYLDHESRR